jgi:hypothetical protein
MSNILILGWGSLVWRAGELRTVGDWRLDGPTLPIEFSRISEKGRLTLVIDELNGTPVRTRSIRSACATLDEAIDNLRIREGSPNPKGIGFADLRNGGNSPTAIVRHKASTETIAKWCESKGADAVIWTAIGPRWPLDGSFSVEAAAQYVARLGEPLRSKAHQYIKMAPAEVITPVRKRFEELMQASH